MNKVLLLLCLSTILSTSNSFTRQLVYSSTCLLVNLFTRQLVNSQTTFPGKRGWSQ